MKKIYFWLYATLIVFIVVLKLHDSPCDRMEYLKRLRDLGFDNVNVIPFHTIRICFDNLATIWAIKNLIGNSLPFFILGILSKKSFYHCDSRALFCYISSSILFLEIVQYASLLGTCDIDDVIHNLTFLKIGFLIDFIPLL